MTAVHEATTRQSMQGLIYLIREGLTTRTCICLISSNPISLSSANAYMLMYRRINRKGNDSKYTFTVSLLYLLVALIISCSTIFITAFTSSVNLPKHILHQIEEEREAERKEQERQEWERNLCKV